MNTTSRDATPVITPCICAWSDLLGFGTALRRGGWHDIDSILPVMDRVVTLERETLSSVCDDEIIFMANDGVARNLDYRPERGLSRLLSWFRDVWMTHERINDIEQHYGHPGIRTVIVAGFRVTYSTGDKKREEVILAKRTNWTLDDIRDVYVPKFLRQTAFYLPFEFQMNLAFAKAYTLEATGSKGGLTGPRLFLDETVIDFLLSTLNGTHFEFHSNDAPTKKQPVKIENLKKGEKNSIRISTPDFSGKYHLSGIILLDPEPITNALSSLWCAQYIMHPTADPEEWERRMSTP